MPWFKVDDGFWSHPKCLALPAPSLALWVRAGSWSAQQMTDGVVPRTALPMLGAKPKDAAVLVDVGLWETTDVGWRFHDWDAYQPTRAQIREEREATAERVRQWRARRKGKGGDDPPDLAAVPSA